MKVKANIFYDNLDSTKRESIYIWMELTPKNWFSIFFPQNKTIKLKPTEIMHSSKKY